MTADEQSTDDEGGEAPCFAHLLDDQMSGTIHAPFVIEFADTSDD